MFDDEEREAIMAQARRHLDPVKREAERQELARRLRELPVPREDPLLRFKADAEAAEAAREEAKRELVAAQAPDWEAVDQRIAAAIEGERKFILTVVGDAIGEMLAEQHKREKQEFTKEVERLWRIVSELQGTIKAFERVDRASRGVPFNDMKTVN